MSTQKGEAFVTVRLKEKIGSLTIHDGRLAIQLEGAGPHRVTRAEWLHSRELRQHAEEVQEPKAESKLGPAGP